MAAPFSDKLIHSLLQHMVDFTILHSTEFQPLLAGLAGTMTDKGNEHYRIKSIFPFYTILNLFFSLSRQGKTIFIIIVPVFNSWNKVIKSSLHIQWLALLLDFDTI